MPPVAIRWVLIRDPQGQFYPQALLCTDQQVQAQTIVEWFVLRWQMEVTFHEGLGLLVWSPLAGGFLSGKYTRELTKTSSGRLASFDYLSILSIDREKGDTVVERLREIAAAHGEATPAQIALAWLLTKPFVSSVILGVSTPEQFADNVNVSSLHLSPEEVEGCVAKRKLICQNGKKNKRTNHGKES